jgi:hypothetical protein
MNFGAFNLSPLVFYILDIIAFTHLFTKPVFYYFMDTEFSKACNSLCPCFPCSRKYQKDNNDEDIAEFGMDLGPNLG